MAGAETGFVAAVAGACAAAIRRGLIYLATGYIFFVYSERVFWARWRDDEDSFGSFIATWIVYSIAAACCIVAVRTWRVGSMWPMVLVGALLGWLVEGVFTMTLFGAGGIPFPVTIAWTGLSWHALLSVVLGWYGLHRAMSHSLGRAAAMSAGLGALWGVWSIYWDRVAVPASPEAFLAHSFGTTVGLIVAFRLYPLLRVGRFASYRVDGILLGLLVLAWFALVTVATLSWLALVTLPPLFALVFVGLRRNARSAGEGDFLDDLDSQIPWSRSLAVLLMPAVASLIHEGCRAAGISAETNLVVFFITVPLGFAMFVLSLRNLFRQRPAPSSAVAR